MARIFAIQLHVNLGVPGFPYGQARNTVGATDGTGWTEGVAGDIIHAVTKAMNYTGNTPTGIPDSDLAGYQTLKGFVDLVGKVQTEGFTSDIAPSGSQVPVPISGRHYTISKGGGTDFTIVGTFPVWDALPIDVELSIKTLDDYVDGDTFLSHPIAVDGRAWSQNDIVRLLKTSANQSSINSSPVYGATTSLVSTANTLLGFEAETLGVKNVVLGFRCKGEKDSIVVIGNLSVVGSENSVGIGNNVNIIGLQSVGVGNNADINGSSCVGMGFNLNISNNWNVGIGADVDIDGYSCVGMGFNMNIFGNQNVGIGSNADIDGSSCVGIGYNLNLVGINSVAIGKDIDLTKSSCVVIGAFANTTVDNSIAIGDSALATGIDTTTVGKSALASARDGVVVGRGASGTGIENVSIGRSCATTEDRCTAMGYRAQAFGSDVTVIGADAQCYFTGGVAIGSNSLAGSKSTAMGWGAEATNEAMGIGAGADAQGIFSGAIGTLMVTTVDFQWKFGRTDTSTMGGYAIWSNFSDNRDKIDIRKNDIGLDFINELKVKEWRYNYRDSYILREEKDRKIGDKIIRKGKVKKDNNGNVCYNWAEHSKATKAIANSEVGLIAQDVVKVLAKYGITDEHNPFTVLGKMSQGKELPENQQSYKIKSTSFIAPLINAVQELSKRLEQLESKK